MLTIRCGVLNRQPTHKNEHRFQMREQRFYCRCCCGCNMCVSSHYEVYERTLHMVMTTKKKLVFRHSYAPLIHCSGCSSSQSLSFFTLHDLARRSASTHTHEHTNTCVYQHIDRNGTLFQMNTHTDGHTMLIVHWLVQK